MVKQDDAMQRVIDAVRKSGGHRAKAADSLGVHYDTVRKHLAKAIKLGIDIPKPPPSPGNTGRFKREEDKEEQLTTKVTIDPDVVKQCEEKYTGPIAYQMALGNWEACEKILSYAKQEMEPVEEAEYTPILDTPIGDICECTRVANVLFDQGIRNIRDLTLHSTKSLMSISGFKHLSVDIVWQSVLKYCVLREESLLQRVEKEKDMRKAAEKTHTG